MTYYPLTRLNTTFVFLFGCLWRYNRGVQQNLISLSITSIYIYIDIYLKKTPILC